jgi:PIN domain nuclease of toxin-antitoxin system
MSYLLDTSAFLWFVNDDSKLSVDVRDILEDPGIDVHLSLVSCWEIAIKANLGRGLELPLPFSEFIDSVLDNYNFTIVEISVLHLKKVADLPLIHRDPFDRLLIAQALAENLPVLTNDQVFDVYQVHRVW